MKGKSGLTEFKVTATLMSGSQQKIMPKLKIMTP